MYEIKPLKWSYNKLSRSWTAETPFGSYGVHRCIDRRCWYWTYCFQEYRDEDSFMCAGVREGKRLAQDHWENRILEALIPVKGENRG